MDSIILLGVLALGILLVIPLIAIGVATAANSRARTLEARLSIAEQRAEQMERRANELDQRLTAWVQFFSESQARPQPETAARDDSGTVPLFHAQAAQHTALLSPLPAAPVAAMPSREETAQREASANDVSNAQAPHVDHPKAPYQSPSPAAGPRYEQYVPMPMPLPQAPAFDWEQLVGVRLFAWLGGGALFLAGALFLQFSIQRNLISPEVRVALGILFGIVALFGGDRLRARTPMAGDALCGAGVALLYAALYSAHALYHLIDSIPAFGGMLLVTVAAGFLAVRQNAYFVALLGMLGGMSTPYLLSTGEDRAESLFAYVAALSVGVVYVSRRQRWPSLALLGLLGASMLYIGWSNRYLDAPRSGYALLATVAIASVYALGRLQKRETAATNVELVLGTVAVLIPLSAAVGLGLNRQFALPPTALSAHLLAVSGLTWFITKRDALLISPLAALLCVIAWVVRVDEPLMQESELLAYACAFAVPLAHFAAWLWHWRRDKKTSLTLSLHITAVGAAVVVFAARNVYSLGSFWVPFSYALGCALLLVGAALRSQRGLALALAQVTVLGALAALNWTSPQGGSEEVVVFVIASGLAFFPLPLFHSRLRSDAMAWISSSLALPFHYFLLYLCVKSQWEPSILGALALASAALSIGMLAATRRLGLARKKDASALDALQGGGALAFITASIPILLSNEWITVSLALEVSAICWLYRRVKVSGLLVFAAVLAGAVGTRLLVNPELWTYHARTAIPVFNHYLYTFGVPIFALFLAAWLLQKEETARTLRLPGAFGLLASVLLFMLLNIEVADYFSMGDRIVFNWAGSGNLAEDMTYSLVWGAFGLGVLVAGLLLAKRAVRIGALGVLVLTIGKVFLHDLWELGSLYRVGSIVGLAIALLGVSYLTQRFILPKENR